MVCQIIRSLTHSLTYSLTARGHATLTTLGWVLAAGWVFAAGLFGAACISDHVAKPHPAMYFQAPKGGAILIGGSGKAGRIVMDGKPRLAPFVCDSDPMLFDVSAPEASIKEGMKNLAFSQGSRRVYLTDEKGDVIAKGRMCIFPTFKTKDKDTLRGYEFDIPMKKLKSRPQGRAGVVFQTYTPRGNAPKSSKHVAWVLYLEPNP